ncbi:MAG TPA: response regulator [Micropepsaceae bacterium]|nr:response regulator [Micropepsaceae bacterium]
MSTAPAPPHGGDSDERFLAGGGELGERMRAYDWASTPLGPPPSWPRSLKTAVRIMLTSRQPIWIGWGPDLIYLYNDPYKSIIGGKHPWALGKPTRQVWAEIWNEIGPMLDQAMRGDEGTYVEAQRLIMERNGYPEETYYTFSYSPVPDDEGRSAGIICANTDDTRKVIGERQLALLRDLAAGTAQARNWRDACEYSAQALSTDRRDLPFALIYVSGPGTPGLSLVARSGISADHPAAPQSLAAGNESVWAIDDALTRHELTVAGGLASRFLGADALPCGPWEKSCDQAAIVPVLPAGETGRAGILIAGLNPYRLFDSFYRDFLGLVAGQIGAAIGNAQAYEEERKRAEALAEIDRAKTTFFSNISHEFRTPLTLILGPLEELLAKRPAQSSRDLLGIAHRNGLRLLRLVNALLDFARLEAGHIKPVFETVDLGPFTAELAANFRPLMDKAGLKFEVDCPPLHVTVFVDRNMWERIVLNLLSNAFKYTLNGGVRIALTPAGQGVELSVTDTGVGIPPEELPRLFERFHRIEGQQGRSFEGSGIGLALVHDLVKLHGGAIRVDSETGKGSRFTITLPSGSEHLPRDRINAARESAALSINPDIFVAEAERWLPDVVQGEALPVHTALGKLARAEPQQGRILFADDNADLRSYTGRLLRQAGYEVMLSEDGAAALDAAGKHAPDLIVTDVMMPRMDGFALLKALRERPDLHDVPVILLSARAGEEARTEGLVAGADDYLTKPFSASELLARIATNLTVGEVRRGEKNRLEEEARTLETLNRVGATVAAELDLERAVQTVTDAATELTGADFGAFFYNLVDKQGEKFTLYAISGLPREAFAKFPQPRNTEVFGPVFRGESVVRSDDVTKDARYGKNAPYHGMPEGHPPVRSFLAAPVISRSGEVLGGLFFGHSRTGVFDARAERLVTGIASQAAIAIDNARLYRSLSENEDRLAKLNENLEQRVEERTSELATANRQLLNQINERERVESTLRQMQRLEAVGQLTSGVAHDFNNLLTVVLGNITFLERSLPRDDEKARLRLSYMRSAAERGAKLTAQLLAFSRRQKLEPKVIGLNEALGTLSGLMRSTIGASFRLELELAGDLWPALADPTQLELVIFNLVINARDASKVGSTITVTTANVLLAASERPEQPPPGEYVMVAVSDTGTGMTPEVVAKCFEPFFTTKGVGRGSGLGLSQVLGFAQQSGGGVDIDSVPGRGTAVRVYLPRAATRAGAAQKTADAPAEISQSHSGRILLVDDDPDVREVTAAMLKNAGYDVSEAGSGGAAIDALARTGAIDAVILDFAMPGMNGSELAQTIRKSRPQLPILFVTGYADIQALADEPVDRILHKPFDENQLLSKIRAAITAQ